MGRVTRTYAIGLSSGERVQLEATNYRDAVSEALERFGARLITEEAARREPGEWEDAIRAIIGTTRAKRFQVEELRAIRGIGAGTCRLLCRHAGEASMPDMMAILRGRVRSRAGEVIAILNARTAADLPAAVNRKPVPTPHGGAITRRSEDRASRPSFRLTR